jgi:enterochelin esterase-like enzyme
MPTLRPQSEWPRGRVVRFEHRSRVLADNPWSDPTDRELSVYLPPGYSEDREPYSVLWDLAGYTSSGLSHVNWRNHGENLPERLDRLIGKGALEPVVVAFPDCYTSLGGNQYVNSASVGRYADYLNEELLPLAAERLNVVPGRDGNAAFGKSSGGYGALFLAMNYPEHWGAIASHAGDMGFELVYQADFPLVCEVLERYGGDSEAFIRDFWRKNRLSGRDFATLMVLAMAASYDPDPARPSRIRLPFDLRTCEVDTNRWAEWQAFDPLNMLDHCAGALKSLHGLYLDVGTRDQYRIQYGTRRFVDRLEAMGVPHFFEEFDGTHSAIDWRLDHSLPYLAKALKKGRGAPINS